MKSNNSYKKAKETFLTRLRQTGNESDAVFRATVTYLFSKRFGFVSPLVLSKNLGYHMEEITLFFRRWVRHDIFYNGEFIYIPDSELETVGKLAAGISPSCKVKPYFPFTPLQVWPASIPFPVIKPYVQPDGKSYSGRQRYNELVDYCYRRRHYPVEDRLQQLLPLYDDVASKAEQKDYIRLTNKVFPSVRRSHLIA